MNLSEKFNEGIKYINRSIWIIIIPILINISELLTYQKIYHSEYVPRINIFTIKFGFISAPPSIRFMLEDFPTVLFQYNNNGLRGIMYKFTPFNIALLVTIMLIVSYINSRYMRVISNEIDEKVHIRDFFELDNELWWKFFILQLILIAPILLMLIKHELIYLSFFSFVLVYVKYSCVVDGGSFSDNLRKGIAFLFDNLGLTIKMAFYFGVIFSLLSIVIFMLAGLGFVGITLDIILVAYLGAAINKAVLEVYRDVNQKEICEVEDEID